MNPDDQSKDPMKSAIDAYEKASRDWNRECNSLNPDKKKCTRLQRKAEVASNKMFKLLNIVRL